MLRAHPSLGKEEGGATSVPRVLGPDRPAWLPRPPQQMEVVGAAAGGSKAAAQPALLEEGGGETRKHREQKQARTALLLGKAKKGKGLRKKSRKER